MTDPDRAPSPTPRIHRLKIEGMRVIEKLDVELRPMNVRKLAALVGPVLRAEPR